MPPSAFALGPRVPRRGNALLRLIGRTVLRALRFSFAGVPPNVSRGVIVVAPHTSNWDFVLGCAVKFALDLDSYFLGKHTLFKGAWGRLMRWAGGIPVDRSAPQGALAEVEAQFASRPAMMLALSPEGTRKHVDRWKSGFHRIARDAGVPIIPVAFDWARREVVWFPVFEATDDFEADQAALRALYRPEMARVPSGF